MLNSGFIFRNKVYLISLLIYLSLSLFLLKYFRYQISPDGVSYISIAEKYLTGNYKDAINGCWGPLISWLLVPFLLLKIPPLLSMKLLSLSIGLFTLIGIKSLIYRFNFSSFFRSVLFFLFIPGIIQLALTVTAPDLLLYCFAIYYLAIIFDAGYSKHRYAGISAGVLGVMIYLSKSYGLPFFIAHFFIFNILKYFRASTPGKKRVVVVNFASGMLIFIALSAIWITAISDKYGKITIGTAATTILGRRSDSEKKITYSQLRQPSNETAISAWEDPYLTEQAQDSKFFTLIRNQLVRRVYRNVFRLEWTCRSFSLLANVILIASFIYCLNLKRSVFDNIIFYTLISMIIYSSGYLFFAISLRYIWIDCVFLALMGAYFLELLFRSNYITRVSKCVLMILFVLSFWKTPLEELHSNAKAGYNQYILSKELEKEYCMKGCLRIASNTNWKAMMAIAFHNKWKYYGKTENTFTDNNFLKKLKENDIDYYFAWDVPDKELECFSKCNEITKGKTSDPRIYFMK